MNPSIAKILSRFDGDINQAIAYCLHISNVHPQFRQEYEEYAEFIAHKRGVFQNKFQEMD
jgi:hypothetical protein